MWRLLPSDVHAELERDRGTSWCHGVDLRLLRPGVLHLPWSLLHQRDLEKVQGKVTAAALSGLHWGAGRDGKSTGMVESQQDGAGLPSPEKR